MLLMIQFIIGKLVASVVLQQELVRIVTIDDHLWKSSSLYRTRTRLTRTTSEWVKSWLKATTERMDTFIYQPDTLSYRQARYRRQYRPINLPRITFGTQAR